MLETWRVEWVQRLLAHGLSQRKVAKITGVSRGRVVLIANGRRPDYEAIRRAREMQCLDYTTPPKRCPSCGHRVYMPCVVCRTRHAMAARSRGRPAFRPQAGLDAQLMLELKENHRARYEQVRARRACGEQSHPET